MYKYLDKAVEIAKNKNDNSSLWKVAENSEKEPCVVVSETMPRIDITKRYPTLQQFLKFNYSEWETI